MTAAPTTVSFQQGVNGYAGTTDATIRGDLPFFNSGSGVWLQLDGNPDISSLINWDISSIPTTAVVESASITLNSITTTAQDYEIYELLKPWVESQVNWDQTAAGTDWEVSGARGATDRGSAVLGSVIFTTAGFVTVELNAAGIALVQSWITAPAANNGIVIQDYSTNDFAGAFIYSSEAFTAANRPILTVTYTDVTAIPEVTVDDTPEDPAASESTAAPRVAGRHLFYKQLTVRRPAACGRRGGQCG